MSKTGAGEFFAGVGVALAFGAGIGFTVDSHSQEVARGKAITAQTCMDEYTHNGVITQQMIDCVDNNWPDGRHINPKKFETGAPVSLVKSYIDAHHYESDNHRTDKILGWSLAFGGVAIAAFVLSEEDDQRKREGGGEGQSTAEPEPAS